MSHTVQKVPEVVTPCALPMLFTKSSFGEIWAENGFNYETHQVTTEDGYILSVFRIPGLVSEEADTNTTKPPILFQHGILPLRLLRH